MVVKVLMCCLLLMIIPTILGALPLKFTKEKHSICFSLIVGYLIEFSLLEIFSIPMILLRLEFKTLLYSWCVSICVLVLLSILLNISKFNLKKFCKKLKCEINLLSVIAIIIILIQVVISVVYTHTDADDSFYVGTATTSIKENSMYVISAYTGNAEEKLPARYVLAPFSLYNAIISSIININPAITAHSIFAPIFIILSYIVYREIALKLFNKNKDDVSMFLIFLGIINIFGNFSIYTTSSFLLFRIWQGKAFLCNIILPAIWLIIWNYIEERNFINWILVFIAMISACFVTEMGLALRINNISCFSISICNLK